MRARFQPRDPENLACVTQTTLSVDDTAEIVAELKARFPSIVGAAQGGHLLRHDQPPGGGEAGRAAGRADDRRRRPKFLQLAAAARSGRARRLPESRCSSGAPTRSTGRISPGAGRVGVTAGASAPEVMVDEVIDAFAERFDVTVELVRAAEENVVFNLPRSLREAAA